MSNKKTIMFGGDVYLDGDYTCSPAISSLCRAVDYVILNIEAPVFFTDEQALGHRYTKAGVCLFQTQNNLIPLLKSLCCNYAGGSNNHIFDYGEHGIRITKQVFNEEKITSFGFGVDINEAKKPALLNGSNISIIGTCEEEFAVAETNKFGCFSMYSDIVIEQISAQKQEGKFVVVFTHGGGEHVPLPSKYIRSRYQSFIDAGADLVVGHHPHIPQGWETYRGKAIFYSLGNFVHAKFPNKWGVLLQVTVDTDQGVVENFRIIPIQLKDKVIDIIVDCKEVDAYFSKLNQILTNAELFESVYQDQALMMYNAYYQNYFENAIFGWKRKIKKYVKSILFPSCDFQIEELSQNLFLLHLLRNNSHREFITTALKLKTKEMTDLRSQESRDLFNFLHCFIREY